MLALVALAACGPRAPDAVAEPVAAPIVAAPTPEDAPMPAVSRVALVKGQAVPFPSTALTATLVSSAVDLHDDGGVRRETSHASLVLADGDERVALTVDVGAFEALGRRWVLHGEAGSLELSLVPDGVHVKP